MDALAVLLIVLVLLLVISVIMGYAEGMLIFLVLALAALFIWLAAILAGRAVQLTSGSWQRTVLLIAAVVIGIVAGWASSKYMDYENFAMYASVMGFTSLAAFFTALFVLFASYLGFSQ